MSSTTNILGYVFYGFLISVALFFLVKKIVYWFHSEISRSHINRFCFFDFETTGLNASHGDRVVEYAFLKANKIRENEYTYEVISSLVNPEGKSIDKKARELHGLGLRELKKYRPFADHIPQIREFIGDRVLVAHNASFDESFLIAEFQRANVITSFRILCSLKLFKRRFSKLRSYSLDSLCEQFGIQRSESHRAEADTKALYMLLIKAGLLS